MAYKFLKFSPSALTAPFLCLLLTFNVTSFAADKTLKQKQLIQLKSKIEKLRQTIEAKENSRSSNHKKLRLIEKQIGSISQKIRASQQSIKTRQRSLARLNKNKKSIQQDINHHNQQLAEQLHMAYTLGEQEQIKLLFSQKDAKNLQRNLVYYEYFSKYRLNQVGASQQHYDRLIANENEIVSVKKALERVLSAQNSQKNSLNTDKVKRKKIVSKLDKQLKSEGKHLTKLEGDAKSLKQLIDSLSVILTHAPTPLSTQKFSTLRGKLSWPVKGDVNKLFGRTKPPSNLRWQGVVIKSRRGNNVRAVSHGQIAFADWLRGMGNLIIIDHGDGYLSLYGHNESLFKSAGEWVEAGDIIGSIGNSGGQSKDGLYFEIRKKGKPQNPSRWCKTKNWFTTI